MPCNIPNSLCAAVRVLNLGVERAELLIHGLGAAVLRTSAFAITAAYLEVQNGWMLAQPLA